MNSNRQYVARSNIRTPIITQQAYQYKTAESPVLSITRCRFGSGVHAYCPVSSPDSLMHATAVLVVMEMENWNHNSNNVTCRYQLPDSEAGDRRSGSTRHSNMSQQHLSRRGHDSSLSSCTGLWSHASTCDLRLGHTKAGGKLRAFNDFWMWDDALCHIAGPCCKGK